MAVDFFKRTWFTSDWHLGHKHVLDFCPRPYSDITEMAEALVANYNSRVKSNHVCYFLGDFVCGPVNDAMWALAQMNGTKILVLGNHDRNHQSMLNLGFDAVLNSFSLKAAGLFITASHFPLKGIKREQCEDFRSFNGTDNWHGEQKYSNTMHVLEDIGQDIHIHGHLHSPNRGHSERICGKQIDIGVDASNYRPVSLNHVIKDISRKG